jgi:N-acetylmuramoyl-L-alanine amidase
MTIPMPKREYLSRKIKYQMPITVAIAVGHTRHDQGAVSPDGITEFQYNVVVAKHLKAHLLRAGVDVVVILERSKAGISDVVRRIAEIQPACAVELHFNSHHNTIATGTETLYAASSTYALAEQVQRRLVQRLGLRDRGLVQRPTGRGSTFLVGLEKRGIPAILPEPFFVSNPSDWRRCREAHQDVAEGIAIGIVDWLLMRYPRGLRSPVVPITPMPILPPR